MWAQKMLLSFFEEPTLGATSCIMQTEWEPTARAKFQPPTWLHSYAIFYTVQKTARWENARANP